MNFKFKNILFFIALAVLSSCNSSSTDTLTVYGSAGSGSDANLTPPSQLLWKALGSPSSLNMNMISFWVSESADCSNPILVGDYGDSPETFDLVNNPVLFTGNPGDGTYNCVLLEVEDTPTFTANAAGVAANPVCGNTTTIHTLDLYREGDNDNINLDGDTVTGRGSHATPTTDVILFAGTTDPDAAVAAGYSANQVGNLANALVIPGTTTFVFDFTDQIATSSEDDTDYCWVEGPEISFE